MALVQNTAVATSASSPMNVPFSPAPTTGNLLVVGNYNAGSAGASAAATNGNAYSVQDQYNSTGTNWITMFNKIFGGTDNATTTITDAPATVLRADGMEWSGLSTTQDGTFQHTTTASTTSQALGSLTTTVANSVVFVFCGFNSNNGGSLSLPGFTLVGQNQRYCSAYFIATTPQTVSPTLSWTTASRPTAMMVALKPTGGATPTFTNFFRFM